MNSPKTIEFTGYLEPYFETGTEGVRWSIYDKSKGRDEMMVLRQNDLLVIYSKDNHGISI